MPVDLKGKEVELYQLPGVNTRIVINGNLFRIVYTKNGGKNFSAELVGKYEPEK